MRPTRHVRVAVVLVAATLAIASVPTAAGQVSVEVTVDDTAVRNGDTVTVTDDPVVDIVADGNEPIASVTVRVDGETRQSFSPNATNVSERFTLDLTDGTHEVAVVIDGDERLTATIRKDSTGPLITYTSPFQSAGAPRTGQVAIDRADATLAATLDDLSGVREVRIERTYEWRFAGRPRRSVETHRIENPGDNVSQPVLFGLGRNELRVVAVDVHGQRRTHDITVWVFDNRQPVIELDRFERTGDGLHVAGTVRDNVKVNSLAYRVAGTAQKNFVLNPTSTEPIRSRTAVDFEFTVSLGDSAEAIVLEATDAAENEREWTVPLDYRGHVEPRITFNETRVSDGGIDVTGTVADGQVEQVVIESVGPDGAVVDSRTVYDGDATSHVEVRGRVAAASGETTVVIRATDVDGRVYRESVTLATPTESSPTRSPTVAPSPTATTAPTPVAATTTAGRDGDGQAPTNGEGPLSTALVVLGVVVGLLVAAICRTDGPDRR